MQPLSRDEISGQEFKILLSLSSFIVQPRDSPTVIEYELTPRFEAEISGTPQEILQKVNRHVTAMLDQQAALKKKTCYSKSIKLRPTADEKIERAISAYGDFMWRLISWPFRRLIQFVRRMWPGFRFAVASVLYAVFAYVLFGAYMVFVENKTFFVPIQAKFCWLELGQNKFEFHTPQLKTLFQVEVTDPEARINAAIKNQPPTAAPDPE